MAGSHSAWSWVKRSTWTCSSAVPSWSRPGDSPRIRRRRHQGRWKRRSRGGLGRRAICTQMTRRLWRGVRFDMVWQAQILVNLGIWNDLDLNMSQSNDPRWAKWDGLIHNQPFVVQMTKIWSPYRPYPYPTPIRQFCTSHWPSLYDGDDPDDPVLVAIVSIVLCFLDALSSLCLIAKGLCAFSSKWCQHIRFGKSHRSQVISKLFPLNIHIYPRSTFEGVKACLQAIQFYKSLRANSVFGALPGGPASEQICPMPDWAWRNATGILMDHQCGWETNVGWIWVDVILLLSYSILTKAY